MKIICVDSNPNPFRFFVNPGYEQVRLSFSETNHSIFEVARRIAVASEPDDLLCVDASLIGQDAPQMNYRGGIKLVKFLRLMELANPVWLYNEMVQV